MYVIIHIYIYTHTVYIHIHIYIYTLKHMLIFDNIDMFDTDCWLIMIWLIQNCLVGTYQHSPFLR